MPNANRHINQDLVILWNGARIDDDNINLKWNSTIDLVEKSAGQETDKSYIKGRRDNTLSLQFAAVGTAAATGGGTVERLMYAGNTGTLAWAPFGTATGKPRYEIPVLVESADRPFEFYKLAIIDVQLKPNGSWVYNYDISGSVY